VCARLGVIINGNRLRTSMAADSSPSRSKIARIAAASASVTTNMVVQKMGERPATGKGRRLTAATAPAVDPII
jgi:hypothetical protein